MVGSSNSCEVVIEFGGGLEALTINQTKVVNLKILDDSITIAQLIAYVRRTVFGAKRDLFANPPEVEAKKCCEVAVEGDVQGMLNKAETASVRAGVLVLVDDIDWELLGGGNHVLNRATNVSFISSLHGG